MLTDTTQINEIENRSPENNITAALGKPFPAPTVAVIKEPTRPTLSSFPSTPSTVPSRSAMENGEARVEATLPSPRFETTSLSPQT
jgi:hypothetical protein